MAQPVLDMQLVPKDEAITAPAVPNVAALIEKLALLPDVDVAKLSALIDMQERLLALQAKSAFDAAFAKMQGELPVIIEHARTNNGTYAPLEDIVERVRPILARNGFSISHRTEWPEPTRVKIIGILAHRDGHEKTSEFLTAADASGNKNVIQGLGSAVSYGRRYTVKDLLNIVTRGEDDDAKRAASAPEPEGYDVWLDVLSNKADEGLPALQAMWKIANTDPAQKAFAAHLTKTEPQTWNALKTKAAKVKAS